MFSAIKDEIGLMIFGRSYSLALATHQCIRCGKPADNFKNELSVKEYLISALCQKCQNQVFDLKKSDQIY